MMILRKADERGLADHGWLKSRHSFSFADYHDPQHMGFRSLRVINDDRVAPGGGFGTHPHRDMEIISYVLEGSLEHRDSMGTGSVIRPGDVQRMSAGTGVTHSEFNGSKVEPVHFLQIWVLPAIRGITPSYEQKHFTREDLQGRFRPVASPEAQDGCVAIHADTILFAGIFQAGTSATHTIASGRHAWIQIARGSARVNGQILQEGDGAALSNEPVVHIEGLDAAELLLFDLA